MAGPSVVIEMSGKEARLWRAQQKIIQQQVKMEEQYRKTGDKAKESGQKARDGAQQAAGGADKVAAGLLSIGTGLVGGMGVLGAVNRVNQAYEVWRANMAEISAEATKAAGEILAFTALQEGGTRAEAVQRASDLGTAYGVADRGEAFSTVQAMQSMHGSLAKGMAAAENIFAASQVGIPVELGREVEVQGRSQGMGVGELLRSTFVAGEASGRDPAAVATAAPGLKFFDDKHFGLALVSQLAGTIRPREIPTYTKRAGEALGDTSMLMEWFEKQGVGEGATQRERLAALAEAGIDTQKEYAEIGLTEKVQQESLMSVVPLFAKVDELTDAIREQSADEGMFLKKRAAIEEELPWMKPVREAAIMESRQADALAFGDQRDAAVRLERQEKMQGTALTEMGMRQAFWFDLQDEKGKTSMKGLGMAAAHRVAFGAPDEERPSTVAGWVAEVDPILRTINRARKFYNDFAEHVGAIDKALAEEDPARKLERAEAAQEARRRARQKAVDDALAKEFAAGDAVEKAAAEIGLTQPEPFRWKRPAAPEASKIEPTPAASLQAAELRDVGPVEPPRDATGGFDRGEKLERVAAVPSPPMAIPDAGGGPRAAPAGGPDSRIVVDVPTPPQQAAPPTVVVHQVAEAPAAVGSPPTPPAAQPAAAVESRDLADAARRLAGAAETLDRFGQRVSSGRVGLGGPDRDR